MMAFLTIFGPLSKDSRRFSEGQTNIPEDFRKISKNFRRLLKTFDEGPMMFWSYSNEFKYNLRDKLDISEIIDIFTSEDMENTPLQSRMSCGFV